MDQRHYTGSIFRSGVLAACAFVLSGATHRLGPCEGDLLCGFDKPEDIAVLDDTDWALVSQHGEASLVWVDLRNGAQHPVIAVPTSTSPLFGAEDCTSPPQALITRGNTIATLRGASVAAVINAAPGNSRIEFFTIQPGHDAPFSQWAGCVQVPAHLVLNDMTLAADGTIFASHMYDPPAGEAGFKEVLRKFREAEDTGYAVRWTADLGWQKVAGTTMSFPNGIALSDDGNRLAIGGTFEQAMIFVDLTTGTTSRVELPLQPDNLTSLPGGAFLATGHTGIPVTGVDGCRPPEAIPCGFPFAVARVSLDMEISVQFAHDGSAIPGASVAVPWRGGLVLGTAYGERLTRVPFWMLHTH